MNSPSRHRISAHSQAFTRLELAALLAAGAMLVLVVFPTFAKSRGPGQAAHCQNNLRRIGLALLMYNQENGGLFPERSATNRWPQRLLSYCGDVRTLVCPSDGENPSSFGGPINSPADAASRSYVFNGWNDYFQVVHGWSRPQLIGKAMTEDAIPQPSQTITFGEKQTQSGHFYVDLPDMLEDLSELEQGRHGRSSPQARDGGSNYAFADGSVRFLTFGRSLDPTNLWAVVDQFRTNTLVYP